MKKGWGYTDPRNTAEYKNCDVCANDIFRHSWKDAGAERQAFNPAPPAGPNPAAAPTTDDQEALIQAITDRVMEALTRHGS